LVHRSFCSSTCHRAAAIVGPIWVSLDCVGCRRRERWGGRRGGWWRRRWLAGEFK
jgi:hypothetical protein